MLHTKRIGRTALALSIAMFSGVNLSANAAQEAGLSIRTMDEPADDNESVARLWHSMSLSYGITRHHYREPDPLGRVDPLDSETRLHPHHPSHTALARQTGASTSRIHPASFIMIGVKP